METDTHHSLPWLLEHLWQLQDQTAHLKPITHPPAHMAVLAQHTDKLQHLMMTLQAHPTPQPREEPVHTTMQAYTNTLHATQRGANLTMSLLQDILMFDGQDSLKLEDWLMT